MPCLAAAIVENSPPLRSRFLPKLLTAGTYGIQPALSELSSVIWLTSSSITLELSRGPGVAHLIMLTRDLHPTDGKKASDRTPCSLCLVLPDPALLIRPPLGRITGLQEVIRAREADSLPLPGMSLLVVAKAIGAAIPAHQLSAGVTNKVL